MPYSILILMLTLLAVKVIPEPTNKTELWNGKWFPHNPSTHFTEQSALNNIDDTNPSEKWPGEWFPNAPNEENSNKFIDANKTETRSNETWTGKWFPNVPNRERTYSINTGMTQANANESWTGKWFPNAPIKEHTMKKSNVSYNDTWPGKWFPDIEIEKYNSPERVRITDLNPYCDDGVSNIDVDFDPLNKKHSYKYLCLDHKSKYEPSFATFPIQQENILPPAYEAPSYCLNETIEYEDRLPTFGAHRYLVPKHGEYIFLPVQRWMSNLEYGAIVMLYHPCANKMQVEKLKQILNACLYRHVITPSTLLLPVRPMALVAWSKSLEMSVVDEGTVTAFIKENAKKGQRTKQPASQVYEAGLLVEAKLVTDESDSEICANTNFL